MPCFNGAATLSLRKRDWHGFIRNGEFVLQWGRNFIVAETSRDRRRATDGSLCFNGAATLSLRKRSSPQAELGVISWLQWGRNFIVAET